MDTRHLHEYVVLANKRSFTLAARELHMTQSALSKHIAALEREFDAEFFMRSSKGVSLTEAGKLLYTQALHIEQLVGRMRRDVMSAGNTMTDIPVICSENAPDMHIRHQCDSLARRFELGRQEQAALVLFLEGCDFKAIEQELGLTRDELAATLGTVYRKTGVGDKQGALDLVQSILE